MDVPRIQRSFQHRLSAHLLPRFSLHISERKLLLVVGDAAGWLIVLIASTVDVLAARVVHFPPVLVAGLLCALVLWWILAWVNGAYDVETASRASLILPAIAKTAVGVLLCLIGVAFFSRGSVGRTDWAACLFAALALIVMWRMSYLKLFSLPIFSRRLLFAGVEPLSTELAHFIGTNLRSQFAVVGFLGLRDTSRGDGPVVADVRDALAIATALRVSEIVASPQAIGDSRIAAHLVECTGVGFKVTPSPLLYEELLKRVPVAHVDPRWILCETQGASTARTFLATKRLIDIALGVLGVATLAAVLPFVAFAIVLDSGLPLFYRQDRVGLRGRNFTLTKFRTMSQHAEVGGAMWAQPCDERITRVGKVLRLSRIDELPQAVNILWGDMSVVGPRPERPEFVEQLARGIPFYNTRQTVKPGLTGWAQVNFPYGSSIDDTRVKLEYDLYYVRHQSLLLDALVILRTIGIVIRLRGR